MGVPFKAMSEPLSILWLSEQPIRPTGYGVVTREIIKRLVKRGHEVNVMGWDYNGEPMKHEEGWSLIHTGLAPFGAEFLNEPDGPTVIDFNISHLKPDLVISLTDIQNTPHIVRACNRMGVPHISYSPIDGFPFFYGYKDLIKMTHTPLWMSSFGREQFLDFVSKYNSKGHGDENKQDPFLDRFTTESIPMIYHGVDIDVFKPVSKKEKTEMRAKLGLSQWTTVFASVGRNGNRKQQPRLLEAFRMMLDKCDNPDEIGLILHTGDPTNSKNMGGWNLPAMIHELKLERNVTFSDADSNPIHGVSRQDMSRIYQFSDCHVSATSGEGFGIPSAEAMACGIPVILPDNSTAPELIGQDSSRGILVKNDTFITGPTHGIKLSIVSVESLAEAMMDMVVNVKERNKMGKRAREFAVKSFDWEIITDQFEELFRSTAGKPHPHGNNSVVNQ